LIVRWQERAMPAKFCVRGHGPLLQIMDKFYWSNDMNKLICTLGLIALAVVSTPASAALNVFACEPEWAALTRQLAGDKADIYTATGPLQDPHQVQARPKPDRQGAQRATAGVHRRGTGNRLDAGGVAGIGQQRDTAGQQRPF